MKLNSKTNRNLQSPLTSSYMNRPQSRHKMSSRKRPDRPAINIRCGRSFMWVEITILLYVSGESLSDWFLHHKSLFILRWLSTVRECENNEDPWSHQRLFRKVPMGWQRFETLWRLLPGSVRRTIFEKDRRQLVPWRALITQRDLQKTFENNLEFCDSNFFSLDVRNANSHYKMVLFWTNERTTWMP